MKNNALPIGLVAAALFAHVSWSLRAGALQSPGSAEPPSPSLNDVIDLDSAERRQFFDQRLTLHCAACHSPEMIEQQRLTLPQWKAEVTKMIGWGATLPKEYTDLMAEHLHAKFPENSVVEPPRVAPATLLAESIQIDSARVTAAEITSSHIAAIFRTQCANCHGPEGDGAELGTRLIGRPILTRPDQFAQFIESGRGRMPAFGHTIAASDIQGLRRWLLGRTASWQAAE